MIHCLFHRDNDGRCSGAIVGKKYGIENVNFIPITYGEVLPWNVIKPEDKVIIVDFSLQKEGEWERLLSITRDIIWIDHHKSAIDRDDAPHHVRGIRLNGTAGAELTWEYFFPDEDVPLIVKYISDYDIWKFEYNDTRAVNQGLYSRHCDPKNKELWDILLSNDKDVYGELLDEIILHGKIIMEYDKNSWSKIMKYQKYFTRFETYKTIACNLRGPSLIFESTDNEEYELMVWWWFNGKEYEYRVSTNRDNIDCSKICEKYGGGGHLKIGGFHHHELLQQFRENVKILSDEYERNIANKKTQ